MANCLSLIEHLADVKGAKITGYDDTNLKSHNVLVLDIVPTQTHVCPFCGRVCPGYDYASKTPKLWRHTDWGSCVVMFSKSFPNYRTIPLEESSVGVPAGV